MSKDTTWWQTGVIYQVYPRSFQDSNGDGIGDFDGLVERLDYLAWLGIDAIWLSPFHPSPNADWGYDVSDYRDVHPDYGTLDGFRRLLDEAHRRDIRVMADFVPNHTSDQHPWFLQSKSSRDNPRRDWYVWHEGDQPPNNWRSTFGGPAWTQVPETGDWYYHFFLPEQPDLNWRNPAVVEAMEEVMRFWLDMGIDGLRLDAVGTLFEDPALTGHHADFRLIDLVNHRIESHDPHAEEVGDMWKRMFGHQRDLPEVHDVMRRWRRLADGYPGTVLLGEAASTSYYGAGDELHLVFNFPLMWTPVLTPAHVRDNLADRIAAMPEGAWLCNTLNNHDTTRARTAFGGGDLNRARLLAALVLLLPGTPVLYQGEEIGMEDLALPVEEMKDPIGPWYFEAATTELGLEPEVAAARAAAFARDRARTPMQWSAGPNAGFTTGEPWLPVHPNHADGIDVESQRTDPDSLLAVYRRLLHLRRDNPALRSGDYEALDVPSPNVLAFLRRHPDQTCVVVLNFGRSDELVGADVGLTVDLFRDGRVGGASSQPSGMVLAGGGAYVGEVVRDHPPSTIGEWSRAMATDARDLLAAGYTTEHFTAVMDGRISLEELLLLGPDTSPGADD